MDNGLDFLDVQNLDTKKQIEHFDKNDNSDMLHLMTKYYSFVNQLAYKYVSNTLELDDLMQEGFLGLLNAIYTFNPENQTSFKTYAKTCILNKMKNFVKASTTKKSKLLQDAVSIDEQNIILLPDNKLNTPENLIIQKEDYLNLIKIIDSELSQFEKKVLSCYLDGLSYLKISSLLNVSKKSIDNAMVRIRQKLKG